MTASCAVKESALRVSAAWKCFSKRSESKTFRGGFSTPTTIFFRNLLYLFKGCGDYELREVFLSRFRRELKIRFAGYSVIPAPSNEAEDEKRGYNHVVEIAKSLDLPILPLLFKNKPFKQSARSFSERRKVKDDLSLKNGSPIVREKILLMDDVVTTGETMKAMIDLVRPLRPKKIRFLALATKKD